MKVQIVSRKLIKPCRPTPQHLQKYRISNLDHLNPTMNAVCILYYESGPSPPVTTTYLEESLAEVTSHFYPLAGRYIKEKKTVECNDEGVEFIEAQVDCKLLQLIEGQVIPNELNQFLPCEVTKGDEPTDPLLCVQLNKFQCGGIAIAISISHRVCDASSFSTFIQAWANNAANSLGGNKPTICPNFEWSDLFPAQDIAPPDYTTKQVKEESPNKVSSRRITFNKDVITSLKAQVGLDKTTCKLPSRIQVVTALVMKAIMRADFAYNGRVRPSVIAHAINIRERTVPQLSKYSFGNMVGTTLTECNVHAEFGELVRLLREDIMKGVAECTQVLSSIEMGRKILVDPLVQGIDKYLQDECVVWFTDWSKFPFYKADFGWGNPIWASLTNVFFDNLVVMMRDREGDGIEAWVHLSEKYMPYFEQDKEIKKFL